MSNAEIAQAFKRLKRFSPPLGSERCRKVVPDLGLGVRSITPKAEVQDRSGFDRPEFSDKSNGRTAAMCVHHVHFVTINLPARVMRGL